MNDIRNIENRFHEELANSVDDAFSDNKQGKFSISASSIVKASEFVPSEGNQKKIIEQLSEESELAYHQGIQDPKLKKDKRKLKSYTLSLGTIAKIDEYASKKRMNKSRFIEMLVEEYEEKLKQEKEEYLSMNNAIQNPAGPINTDLHELANRVAKIIETNNLIKTS